MGTLNEMLCEGRMTVIIGWELVEVVVVVVVVVGVWVSRECGRTLELPVGGGEGGEDGESDIYNNLGQSFEEDGGAGEVFGPRTRWTVSRECNQEMMPSTTCKDS